MEERFMHPICRRWLPMLGVLLMSPVTQAANCPDPLDSLGGDTWREVTRILWDSQAQNYEPGQTFHPGAAGLHISDDRLKAEWLPARVNGKLDWQVSTYYPLPGEWQYQEIIDQISQIKGRDGFAPTDSAMTPSRRHMRLITILQHFPALLLLHGQYTPGENLCQIAIEHPTGSWRLWLNPADGLPRRSMLLEQDPLNGEVENVMSYSEWHEVDGLRIAKQLEQTVNNQLVRRERLGQVQFEHGTQAALDNPAMLRLKGADVPEWSRQRSHWLQRQVAGGTPQDTDTTGEVSFHEVAPNVFHVTGGTHHNLVIVTRASLVVVEAPWDKRRSAAVIQALASRWPDKPVSHLILTHHHSDHSDGLMSYVEAGATLIMGVPMRHYLGTVFAKSGRRNIPNKTIADQYRINAYGDLIDLYHVPNSHAEGMLVVYLRNRKLLFNSDLFSPGSAYQNPLWTRELLNTIDWLGLEVDKVVGSHGQGTAGLDELRRVASSLEMPTAR